MHTLLLAAAIALAGQVAEGSGHRYSDHSAAAEGTVDASTPQGQPTSQPMLPQQQPAASYPADHGHSDTAPPSTAVPSNQIAATNNSATKIKPLKLIRSLLKPPAEGKLVGSPLSLAEAVQGAGSREEQTRRVEAYWDLSAAVANYYTALREVPGLQTLYQGVRQPGAQWEQAWQTLNQRGQVARQSAQAAQIRLQQMLGRSSDSILPLPSDFPHCGAYDSRYDEIFNGRHQSLEAQQLHQLLPLEHQNLSKQAASVVAAHRWLETVSQRRNPQTDGSGLLKAHELLSLRRRAFVTILCSYNTSIARYAELATPERVGTGRLVAMLIQTDTSQSTSRNSSGIRRTSAEETFDSSAEHSILTRPGN